MATLTISMPGSLEAWVNEQVHSGQYADASDYLCGLVEADRQAKQRLDGLLLEGLDSGEPVRVGPGYWIAKKRRLAPKG